MLMFLSLQFGDFTHYAKSAEEALGKYDADKDSDLVRDAPDTQNLPPEWFLKVSFLLPFFMIFFVHVILLPLPLLERYKVYTVM